MLKTLYNFQIITFIESQFFRVTQFWKPREIFARNEKSARTKWKTRHCRIFISSIRTIEALCWVTALYVFAWSYGCKIISKNTNAQLFNCFPQVECNTFELFFPHYHIDFNVWKICYRISQNLSEFLSFFMLALPAGDFNYMKNKIVQNVEQVESNGWTAQSLGCAAICQASWSLEMVVSLTNF